MKILVYGAGVIGSLFAGRLAASGHDLTLLARGRRLQEVRENGLILYNVATKKQEKIPVKTIETLAPDSVYDYVLVVMQRTQVDAVLDDLAKNASQNIVMMVNTAGGYDLWLKRLGRRLMIAFPSAGGERAEGVVRYFVGRGAMRLFQTTTVGEAGGGQSPRSVQLINALKQSGIPAVFCADMDAWQKTHVALITSIGNAFYRFHCDHKQLAASFRTLHLMVRGFQEGFCVLAKLGIRQTPRKLWYLKLPAPLLTPLFQLFMRTEMAHITMAKHCMAAKDEMTFLQAEFDALIAKSGLDTPAIDELKQSLL